MGVHIVKDKYFVFKGEKDAEDKFRTELSNRISDKFGNGPFENQDNVREIVVFSLEYYISKFKEICHSETSDTFYRNIFWFHEQATELAFLHPHQDISPEISGRYIASYRRILKFILEMGCEVSMATGETTDQKYKQRIDPIVNDLLYLGERILTCVDLYAEQSMIEDVVDISFEEGKYFFSRRHHYEFIFEHISKEFGSHLTKSVVDNSELAGLTDLKKALQDCFGIRYEDVGHLIATIHEELKSRGGETMGVGWETLTVNLNRMFGVPLETAEYFFKGLRLDKSNKMDLMDLACKPYKLNRYLYRPIIIWNIDGKDFAFVGKNCWTEAILQYSTNAIPWGKAPEEWMKNQCFKTYVHRKEDDHDKWLDDEVEKILQTQGIMYDRNVKQIKHKNGTTSIDVSGLGEIDFIILSPKTKTIYICDCKHLLGRYDLVNQKNDFNAFSVGSRKTKSYNETMKNKLVWFNDNKSILEEHFQKKYKGETIDLSEFDTQGIFIVNTPTFYMYNAEYRIYTINQIESVLSGQYEDPTFMIVINEEEQEKILNVKYPYFKKPQYITFEPFADMDETETNL
ncbi:hypothetical protein [uncultured Marivirga sp.]|uniref:hypothetical protein n=1 Tax=uncultured Marivirga sp. TaxID=1123707 RepID=UPI0030EB6649|tara:strand:+ start:1142 stop:2857 length:1716 start_codon:yes stop_codon:yes gene_type:complete